jgi:Ni,Fe-hydrogenase I cytochrome b subunit
MMTASSQVSTGKSYSYSLDLRLFRWILHLKIVTEINALYIKSAFCEVEYLKS